MLTGPLVGAVADSVAQSKHRWHLYSYSVAAAASTAAVVVHFHSEASQFLSELVVLPGFD